MFKIPLLTRAVGLKVRPSFYTIYLIRSSRARLGRVRARAIIRSVTRIQVKRAPRQGIFDLVYKSKVAAQPKFFAVFKSVYFKWKLF